MSKGWPTVSKGVFYPGFKGNEGQSPSERKTDTKKPAASPQSAQGRMVYQATNKLTAVGMRKPI